MLRNEWRDANLPEAPSVLLVLRSRPRFCVGISRTRDEHEDDEEVSAITKSNRCTRNSITKADEYLLELKFVGWTAELLLEARNASGEFRRDH